MINKKSLNTNFTSAVSIGIALILAVMPFHAALTVVFGVYGHSISAIQLWKEIIIGLLALVLVARTILNRRLPFKLDVINVLAVAFIAWSLIVSLFAEQALRPILVGFKTDCMMVLLFLIAQSKQTYFSKRRLTNFLLIPACVVAVLAVLQSLSVPIELLGRLGYGADSINPVQIVDGSLGLLRAFSTLGGPNQLGAYMILPIVLAINLLIQKRTFILAAILPVLLAALVLSYSRSAWIGAIVAIIFSLFLLIPARLRVLYSAIVIVAIVVAAVAVGRIIGPGKVTHLQNVLLHGRNFDNQIQGSDQSRISVMAQAAHDIVHHPVGYGLGSAGPASIQSTTTRITENWFLQIGLETGLVGLFIMVSFLLFIIWEIVRVPQTGESYLAYGLAAGLIGVMVSGLFLHSLADSTLAYIIFASLGLNRQLVP